MSERASSTAGDLRALLSSLRASESGAALVPPASEGPPRAAQRVDEGARNDSERSGNLTGARQRNVRGKRSDPSYRLIGLYVPRAVYDDVRRLLVGRRDHDLSDLVSSLLRAWLEAERGRSSTNVR